MDGRRIQPGIFMDTRGITMARFWQHMASSMNGPVGGFQVSGGLIHQVADAVGPETPVAVSANPSSEAFETKESWNFLEVGPEGREEGSAEVILERNAHQRRNLSSSKSVQGIPWEMPYEVEKFPSQVLRPMFDSVKAAVDGFGSGLIIASHSSGLGAKRALPLVLAMAVRAVRESWRIAIIGGQGIGGEYKLPGAPGWLDYLQGNSEFQEILHPWKKGDVAWIPQGRSMNCDEPIFFRHSPANWLRELKKIYSAVLLVCGAAEEDSLLSSVARMGDGVFVLANFQEANSLCRFQEDWARRGVPFLGQVVLPERFSASATHGPG